MISDISDSVKEAFSEDGFFGWFLGSKTLIPAVSCPVDHVHR